MFVFTSRRLRGALGRAQARGVKIRLLLDDSCADEAFVDTLRKRGVVVRRVVMPGEDPARYHHKYAVFDERVVATGSYNWTYRGDTPTARTYLKDFEKKWNDEHRSRR